jgi:hypothetical protein
MLLPLFARSSQAARTVAKSFFEGGVPIAVRHSFSSEEALAGVTALPGAQAMRSTSTKPLSPCISNTYEIDENPRHYIIQQRRVSPSLPNGFMQRIANEPTNRQVHPRFPHQATIANDPEHEHQQASAAPPLPGSIPGRPLSAQ